MPSSFSRSEISETLSGKIVVEKNVTYNDRRTRLAVQKAIDITTPSVECYKTLRLTEKAAPATVTRELAALKRMFRLGLRHGVVATMP